MDKMQWIKDLVKAEQAMEESGVIDVTAGFDPNKHLNEASFDFINRSFSHFFQLGPVARPCNPSHGRLVHGMV